MADLQVDMEMLDSTRHELLHISRTLKKPGQEMAFLDSSDMGVHELSERVRKFGDEWSYGIEQLTKFSDSAADALLQIKKSFEDLDRRLEEALGKQGGPHNSDGQAAT